MLDISEGEAAAILTRMTDVNLHTPLQYYSDLGTLKTIRLLFE